MVATANAGGYRYGVSDQAFYIPVILRALDPSAFPRDATLIDAQGKLMLADEAIAGIVRVTGLSLEHLFFAAYLLSLALIWIAIVLIGNRLYQHRYTTLALGFLVSLRHRIPRTSANSFEPYFHPRMLAFGICLLATAAVLRRRPWTAIVLVAVAALVHITTALWFALLLGVAILCLDQRLQRLLLPAAVAVAAAAVAVIAFGPLRASLTRMDPIWLQAVASKDSLFATEWPLWPWLLNLGLVAVILIIERGRVARGVATPESRALVWGTLTLTAVFLLTLPLVAARYALPVQLQISRVFWPIDFIAAVFIVGEIVDRHARRALVGLVAIALIAIGRGTYILRFERVARPLVAISLPDTPWEQAMAWVRTQPTNAHVLADPGHAWKYGTSVRVSGQRDVFLEDVKDAAIAIYSHDVAARVVERSAALGDFSTLTAERARALASEYHLDFLVTEATLPLPLAYSNRQFHIYRLS
ncbi:MAG TPA: hypothetical protein VL173_17460 [Vicinamibacterales bacterium]|nr:hypothetical protein [Vicinamibacterales bacterium]